MTSYAMAASLSFIHDTPDRIDYHVQTGDYFSFLATILGFVEESLARCGADGLTEEELNIARQLRHDLRYVQANYKILPREGGEIEHIPPSGNLLLK